MWWKGQNLDKPIADSTGKEWHFRVWHDHKESKYLQRIYFWDTKKLETGVIEFRGDQTVHIRKIKDRIRKLIADPTYRQPHLCPLKFPIEKYY